MQCLQPADPDVQKHFIQKRYNLKIQLAIKLYTMDIKQRAIHLFKHVNVSIFYVVVLNFQFFNLQVLSISFALALIANVFFQLFDDFVVYWTFISIVFHFSHCFPINTK